MKYMGVSVYWSLSVQCIFSLRVCVCVISNQSTSEKLHYVLDLNKIYALLYKTLSKVVLVLRFQGSTFMDP